MASFVLGWVWAADDAADEPNSSEPAGPAAGAAAAGAVTAGMEGVAERKSAKGSASAGCDGGDMSVKYPHTCKNDRQLNRHSD